MGYGRRRNRDFSPPFLKIVPTSCVYRRQKRNRNNCQKMYEMFPVIILIFLIRKLKRATAESLFILKKNQKKFFMVWERKSWTMRAGCSASSIKIRIKKLIFLKY